MKRMIELKHVGEARDHVRGLLESLCDRLEEKLAHFPKDAVSLHVLFEEHPKLFHTAVTCHIPGHTVAAHEEQRQAGLSIRKAFAEVARQLERQKANVRHDHLRRQSQRGSRKLAKAAGFTEDGRDAEE
jgi:ribosome-associated translation inhibitor RaiA